MAQPLRDDDDSRGAQVRRSARQIRSTPPTGADVRGKKVAKTMRTTSPRRKTSTLNMIRRLSERLISGEGPGKLGGPDTGVPVSHISSPPMPADEFEAVASTPRRARRLF